MCRTCCAETMIYPSTNMQPERQASLPFTRSDNGIQLSLDARVRKLSPAFFNSPEFEVFRQRSASVLQEKGGLTRERANSITKFQRGTMAIAYVLHSQHPQ